MLLPGEFANELKSYILQANQSIQDDPDKAIDAFCNKLEQLIDQRIKNATITILSGQVIVAGSPSTQVNPAPIVLNKAIS